MTVKMKPQAKEEDPKTKPEGEEVEGEEQKDTEEVEEQEEEKEDDVSAVRAENKELRDRLDRLESSRQEAPKSTITATQLEAMNEQEREFVEKQSGMAFDEVVRRVKRQEQNAWEDERVKDRARVNVRDAIEDAVDSDPKVSKLKVHIKDFFADISDSEKSNPERVRKLMKKAVTYAKGAAGVPDVKPSGDRVLRTSRPEEDGGDEDMVSNDPKSGKIKPGMYRFSEEFKINIENLVPEATRKRMQHPEHLTGIRIPHDFDEPPKFR